MFTTKRAVVSVINDLVTDNRVIRTCNTLREAGFEVLLIGRSLPHSPPLPAWSFRALRMRLFFTKGPPFYFFFNLRLFFRLMSEKAALVYANDLDTLLPNFLVSKIRGIPLIYDSHELFCEVPELQDAPLKRAVWRWLEARLVPRVKYRITVNESIASIFRAKYGTEFKVVRNIPDVDTEFEKKPKIELGLPADRKIILLQGAGININRGAEELMEAMKHVEGALLLIIGGGDVWPTLLRESQQPELADRVRMIPRMPASELRHYTMNSDIGVSIDKPGNPNYDNSLPNKVFDYIQAGLPVLATRLTELQRVLSVTGTGLFIENHDPAHIAAVLNKALEDGCLAELKQRALAARSSFTWLSEKSVLFEVLAAANAGG